MSVLEEILARGPFSPTTRAKYIRVIRKWTEFAGDDPNRWTQPTAQAFYDGMLARGVSPKSANVYIASLRYVSRWYAVQSGQPDFAIVQVRNTDGDTDDDSKREALTKAAVIQLIQSCEHNAYGFRDRGLIIVGLETGMRRMSLGACRFNNLSERGDYPTIKVPVKGPGGKRLFAVPLSATAMRAIDDVANRLELPRKHGPIFPGITRKVIPGGALRLTPTSTPFGPEAIYKMIVARGKRIGLDIHPHLLRHTFITWREEQGLNAPQIASITGHQTFGVEWANLKPYIDMKVLAGAAREATPAWLADFVREELARG